eukprot:1188635-Amphidinium_carterae.1
MLRVEAHALPCKKDASVCANFKTNKAWKRNANPGVNKCEQMFDFVEFWGWGAIQGFAVFGACEVASYGH